MTSEKFVYQFFSFVGLGKENGEKNKNGLQKKTTKS